MKGIVKVLIGVTLMTVLSCAAAWEQATAQISGSLRDQSGALRPGAEITATQTETGIARNTVSNRSSRSREAVVNRV